MDMFSGADMSALKTEGPVSLMASAVPSMIGPA
jgi:hypothetical protein